jgi:PIN domain nuclease of toxin-antitoxin system
MAAGGGVMLLDTCALLWLVGDEHQLSKVARRRIGESPVVYISAITGFEISMKHRSGKLVLPVPPVDWLKSVLRHHNIEVIPLCIDICIQAVNLPPIHKDPCDRFIIATAKLNDLVVVTADEQFARYGVEVVA